MKFKRYAVAWGWSMKNTKVMKRVCMCVCVCVCRWVWFEKARNGIECTYAFVRSGNSAVSGVRSSVVCARGCWEVAVGGAPDVKFALVLWLGW